MTSDSSVQWPAMIEAAMTMPPVNSPWIARNAPQPSIAICVSRRAAREAAAKMMLRSCALTWAVSEAAVSLPQIDTASGIIAMALMIWLLRDIESRWRCARDWAAFAVAKGLAVAFWLRMAMTRRISEVTTTIIPRCG